MRSLASLLATLAILATSTPVFAAATPTDAATIARGKYLARAGDCIACHTRPGGKPFAGGLAIDTPFGAVFTPNITPDPGTGIGKFSEKDFVRALHQGINPRGEPYIPVFPYPFFTQVSEDDILAIFAYIKTVEPVPYIVPANELRWPYSYRPLLFAWQELFFKAGYYQPNPAKSSQWNRGAYLVDGLGHCGACHTPMNALGGWEKNKSLSGAEVDHWFAPNISGDLRNGIGSWSTDDVVSFLRSGQGKPMIKGNGASTEAMGPMAEVVHDSLSWLSDDDIRAIAVYLKDSKAPEPKNRTGAKMPLPPATENLGQQIYTEHCLPCHQGSGLGIAGVFPALAQNPILNQPNPADVILTVLRGAPADPGEALSPNTRMPPFASQLNDEQIAAVVSYIRTRWGNTGGAVSEKTVTGLRKAK